MALAFAAKSAASAIIEKLIDAASSYVKYEGPSAMQDEIQKIQDAFPQIRTILAYVEGAQNGSMEQNEGLDAWLWQLRDAVEQAEDVLDEMEYYELEKQVQAGENKVQGTVLNSKRKLTDFLNNNFFGNDTLKRLREAVKALDKVAASVGPLLQLVSQLYNPNVKRQQQEEVRNARETSSFLTENQIYGRDKERDVIVEWLTKPTSDEPRNSSTTAGNVSAFAIVGIGGLGKTTLAQLIYHDDKVRRCFDLVMWVCVSDIFDVAMLTKKILEEAVAKVSDSLDNKSLNTIQKILKEKLISKKFLLVLDDVWNDDKILEWEKLVAPLKFGGKGSKILLTTRMDSVADMVARVLQGKRESLKLSGLEENDFTLLFNKHAFAGVNIDDHRNLQLIGRQIAKKLGGCPLAAKILGGYLNSCMDENYWRRILNENFLNLQESKDNIVMVLRLSYHHLPTSLQICFRYCSIFPKDRTFKKDELVYLWIGSGLIKQPIQGNQSLEDIAERYLDHLVRKSFFDIKTNGGVQSPTQCYVMHDLLHDLAQFVSLGECLGIEGDGSGDIPKTIRHIRVRNADPLMMISHLKNLRTLIIYPNKDFDVAAFNDVLKELKSLRLLSVSAWNFKFPDEVGSLIHLRYLSLYLWPRRETESDIYLLPQFLGRLYHLEVMKLPINGIEIDYSAKEGMSNLVKLRLLDIPFYAMAIIPWIGKLTSLRNLDHFLVREECGYNIGQLKNLRNLRRLSIGGLQNVRSSEEAADAKLIEKENLDKLSLVWSTNRSGGLDADEPLLDNLRPHTNLKELAIEGYAGVRSPRWMTAPSLSSITSIDLSWCERWEELPPFGQLPLLEFLRLKRMPAIKKLRCSESVGGCAFPSLKELGLEDMPKLELFEGEHLFPQLIKLAISCCPSLKSLPALPHSLNELEISEVGLTSLPTMQQDRSNDDGRAPCSSSHPSLSHLTIRKCPNLTSLDGFMLRQQFPALRRVSIKECGNLRHLPTEFFQKLPSVEYVAIKMCPRLMARGIRDNPSPKTIKKLSVGSNGDFDLSLVESLPVLTSLTNLTIDGRASLTSLPPAEVLARLASLSHLDIWNCKELSSLDGLQALPSLTWLSIKGCDKLTALSPSQPPLGSAGASSHTDDMAVRPSMKLQHLEIDRHTLLLVEPLRNLNSVSTLDIKGGAELTSFPEQWLLQNRNSLQGLTIYGALSLQSLPPIMINLCSLRTLHIFRAPLLRSIPELPASMRYLEITGCHPKLKEYIEGSGRVANIPRVYVTE